MPMSKGKKEKDIEWEKRTLCSDGNCTGVIGADGRCKECGKPYEGDLPETGVSEARDSDEAEEHGAGRRIRNGKFRSALSRYFRRS